VNVVDSSGWLEYFANGSNADFFAAPLADTSALIVPAISIFEVFKRVLSQRDEADALQVAALMRQGRVVPLDEALALSAAKLSFELKLPMADSIMLATARQFEAQLWTQDADFAAIPGVRYVAKAAGR
jgi:predicted nucleic acid-binding protein